MPFCSSVGRIGSEKMPIKSPSDDAREKTFETPGCTAARMARGLTLARENPHENDFLPRRKKKLMFFRWRSRAITILEEGTRTRSQAVHCYGEVGES